MAVYYNVKVKSGIYKIRNPTGRVGAIHMGILTKYLPQGNVDPEVGMSPMQQERVGQGFEEWAQKVLPQIFVGFTPEGESVADTEYKYEDIPWADQFALFSALTSQMDVDEEFFRII